MMTLIYRLWLRLLSGQDSVKNAEGYYDLTAYEAIKNVTAEERRKKAMYILSLSCSKKSKSKKCKVVSA